MVVVRPSRHTHGFTEKHDTFTLSAFGPECRRQLELCGAASGRDTDKVKATGLTPVASTKVEAPAFDQAELVLECRKIYRDKIDPGNFLADDIEANYKGSDYHTVYFGEILAIHGVAKYRRR
jgi:flavin reductase (DIM6/NTAB) family NADH-FMN oxidoreductase RutF